MHIKLVSESDFTLFFWMLIVIFSLPEEKNDDKFDFCENNLIKFLYLI